MVRAEAIEYLETFIRNDSKGLAALSKTNVSSWNLTLMQGFTNNVIKNVIIVVLPLYYSYSRFRNEQKTGYVFGNSFTSTDAIEHNDEYYASQYSEMSGSSN